LLEQVDEEDMLNLAYSSDVVLLLDDTAQDVADTVVSGVIEQNNLLGLTAVFFSCLTSGFAGVYFERVLKGSQTSLWVRNIQLGVFGAICSFVLMVLNDYSLIAEQGLLYGYNGYVYTVILNQALGGLVVALVVRYSDQILKGFALSVAVVLSCFVSIFMFDFKPTVMFALGALMVVASVFLYSFWGGKGEKQSNKSSILPVSHKEDD
jgi:UDP-sugar transporter A1/2/3